MSSAVTERMRNTVSERFAFGPFVLSVSERLLSRDGVPVQIGSRSLDLLIALVRNPGRVIGKSELIALIWGEVTVDDGALRVHVAGLRKALLDRENGARYIATVPGQGYSLVAPVTLLCNPAARTEDGAAGVLTRLPPVLTRVVGRDRAVAALSAQIVGLRFMSLVGPGGIGKTTVAIKALHQLGSTFDGDIHFINLSLVTDPGLVSQTVASMVGAAKGTGNPTFDLLNHLKQRRCLLVLDSCEHVIEPAATLAATIIQQAPLARLLTTTREPLRVEGEHVMRLPSLGCPPRDVALTAAEIFAFPAVEMFVERVAANVPDFTLTDENAPVVADICRKLDGIALAIELCAGRVEAFGLTEMVRLLERRLGLVWRGRRTAPPRHQTLHATLEWSHSLLEHAEQVVFARLGIFSGPFTLEAAEAIAADRSIQERDVVEIIASLVAKSLLSPVIGRSPQRYRFLDTTRAYALEKLAGSSDEGDVERRHAQFVVAELQRFGNDPTQSSGEFLERLNDIRSALEWSFVKEGDSALGVTLAAAAASPLVEHSLCGECQRWTEYAIASLTPAQQGTALELELQISLGWSASFTAGKGEAAHGAFLRGLAIANSDPDLFQQLRLLNGLSYVLAREGDLAGALVQAERAVEVARQTSDPSVMTLANWNVGVYHHLCGNQGLVRSYCESAVTPPASSFQARRIADDGYNYRGRALIALARAHCLLGFPDQAVTATRFVIKVAEEADHPLSLFVVLIHATIAFIWCNDWPLAEATITRLRTNTQTSSLVYRTMGAALQAVLVCRRRGTANSTEIETLRQCLGGLVEARHLLLVPLCRVTLAEALLRAGSLDEAGVIIDAAVDDLGTELIGAEGPEILRVKGAVMVTLGQAEAGESMLLRALELARSQSALWWELRAATSLALVRNGEGRARALVELEVVIGRCREGHGTDDFRAAKEILAGARSSLG